MVDEFVAAGAASMGDLCSSYLDFWNALRGDRDVPLRDDFDVVDLAQTDPRVVPHVWILDVVEENGRIRYRYRLVGGALRDARGMANIGDYLDEYDGDGTVVGRLDWVRNARVAGYRRGAPGIAHARQIREVEVMIAPYADAEGRIVSLINCSVYHWQRGFARTRLTGLPFVKF